MSTAVNRYIASTATVFIATNAITCPLLGCESNDILCNHKSEDVGAFKVRLHGHEDLITGKNLEQR